MDFGANKTPVEIIKGAFGEFFFRDIKEFSVLKDIDQKYYCSNYYDAGVNKYGVKCGTSLRFWKNKGWIHPIDPYGWFQWVGFRYWLDKRSVDDEQQINRWKKIVN